MNMFQPTSSSTRRRNNAGLQRMLNPDYKRNDLRPSVDWLYGERPVVNADKRPAIAANAAAKGAAARASFGGGATKPNFDVVSKILFRPGMNMAMRPSPSYTKSAQDPRRDYV